MATRADTSASGQFEIRRANLSRLLTSLHLEGPQSRSQLANRLGVNRSTVASLVLDLASRGLVIERAARRAASLPGRPSPVVDLAPHGPVALALELSTDWFAAAVVAMGGVVVSSTIRDEAVALMSPEDAVAQLYALASSLPVEHPERSIIGVGVSVPGSVRQSDGWIAHAPNLGWRNVALGDMLRERFGSVPVAVGNDADLATLAEHLRGAGRGTSDFICLWGEGGIGAGIVVAGRPLAGSAGLAGEVGHMTVNPNGRPCRCGSRGCWEVEVGENALLTRSGRDPMSGREGVADLLRSASNGEELSREAIDTTGKWLGIGIAGLINVFNPSKVALGGVYARIYPYVRETVEREIQSRALVAPRQMAEVLTVRLGSQALLLGAAELTFAPILADPTLVAASSADAAAAPARSAVALGQSPKTKAAS